MTLDKYGTGDDPYCYSDSSVLRNLLNIEDDAELANAEQEITELAVDGIDFEPPPYDFGYFKKLHSLIFEDVYEWAGKVRTIDMSKGDTRFCTCSRITPETDKIFQAFAEADYYQHYDRENFVKAIAELYVELNMAHPFREGNGRAQRMLFEHIIINAGYEFDLESVTQPEWIDANIAGVGCNYEPMITLFSRCIGDTLDT